jgi:hypothetical protein
VNGITELSFSANNVKSLHWHGDILIDWVHGGNQYFLDSQVAHNHIGFAYRFDAATVSPSGNYAVIYERCGTKGLILDIQNKQKPTIVRQINRSFYQAHVYEYPVVLFQLEDGREVIAHCPYKYCVLEIEETVSGICLTQADNRKPIDSFYSRLATSPDGKYLMSAGWVWHPTDVLSIFDVEIALSNPHSLDSFKGGIDFNINSEVASAAFVDNNHLLITTSSDGWEDEDVEGLQPNSIGVFDLDIQRYTRRAKLEETAGTVMPLTLELAFGFYEYPKLIHIPTGKILHRLSHLDSGRQVSSIIHYLDYFPILALDPVNHRFALAADDKITVVTLDPQIIQTAISP